MNIPVILDRNLWLSYAGYPNAFRVIHTGYQYTDYPADSNVRLMWNTEIYYINQAKVRSIGRKRYSYTKSTNYQPLFIHAHSHTHTSTHIHEVTVKWWERELSRKTKGKLQAGNSKSAPCPHLTRHTHSQTQASTDKHTHTHGVQMNGKRQTEHETEKIDKQTTSMNDQ